MGAFFMSLERVILFDGVCNLCNGSVKFVLKNDPKGKFSFASLQSSFAKTKLNRHFPEGNNSDSVVLLEGDKAYTRSTAALRIARGLKGAWPLVYYLLIWVPPIIRNTVYSWIARNRYKWFGKRESCMMPQPKWQHRFIDL